MRRFISLVLLFYATILGSAQAKIKIAVLDLKARSGIDKMTVSSLTDYTCTVIAELGNYDVIGKDDMRAMLEHVADQQLLDCDDTKCLTELGGALGGELLVSGNIGMVGRMYLINLKLIDIENAMVQNRLSDEYRGDETGLVGQLKVCIHKLFKVAEPPEKAVAPVRKKPEKKEARRPWRLVIQPGGAFSYYSSTGVGFALGIGIQYPKNYFGLHATVINQEDNNPYIDYVVGLPKLQIEDRDFNGAALVYYRKLNAASGFGFYIGGMLGMYYGYYEYYDGKEEVYYDPLQDLNAWHLATKSEYSLIGVLGPKVKLDFGFQQWRLGTEATLILGLEEERQFNVPAPDMDDYDSALGMAGLLELVLSFSI
jgi:hypothetical protein